MTFILLCPHRIAQINPGCPRCYKKHLEAIALSKNGKSSKLTKYVTELCLRISELEEKLHKEKK